MFYVLITLGRQNVKVLYITTVTKAMIYVNIGCMFVYSR